MRTVEGVLIAVLLMASWPASARPGDEPARESRLKFRNGPACMCNDGLDEKAIRAAEHRRAWTLPPGDKSRPSSSDDKTKGE